MTELNRMRHLAGLTMESARGLLKEYTLSNEGVDNCAHCGCEVGSPKPGCDCKEDCHSSVNEAGGYYTQPVYDMIEKHGYEKVMHELLTSLNADAIQSFLTRANFEN